jgi:hypothetical protein
VGVAAERAEVSDVGPSGRRTTSASWRRWGRRPATPELPVRRRCG